MYAMPQCMNSWASRTNAQLPINWLVVIFVQLIRKVSEKFNKCMKVSKDLFLKIIFIK